MNPTALDLFHKLCQAADTCRDIRLAGLPPAILWGRLEDLEEAIDACVDLLVTSTGLDAEEDDDVP